MKLRRLPPADRAAFIETFSTRPTEQHGRALAEYVDVPPKLLAKTRELKPYFDKSYAYVSSLKPNPTTKRR
jgi:hypothetical protein